MSSSVGEVTPCDQFRRFDGELLKGLCRAFPGKTEKTAETNVLSLLYILSGHTPEAVAEVGTTWHPVQQQQTPSSSSAQA